tara:strand:+ start:226 stop:423 length:198 start_codon:yes stop_codon:yes gene_type:complete
MNSLKTYGIGEKKQRKTKNYLTTYSNKPIRKTYKNAYKEYKHIFEPIKTYQSILKHIKTHFFREL